MSGFKKYTTALVWIFIAFLLLCPMKGVHGQSAGYRFMFYNTENLFDTFDDPAINDDEFTPDGELHWTSARYWKKLNNTARVITAVGEWSYPDLVGLCEIENFQVLMDLTTRTPLKNAGYRIIHENSPDPRGIDVAMLFRPDKLSLISHTILPVGEAGAWTSRDMLLCGFLAGGDTINVIVCHWPSRSGGASFSVGRRELAARVLRQAVDSLQDLSAQSKILILGDFNDEPGDRSLSMVLRAEKYAENPADDSLVNLSFADLDAGRGTLVHTEINKSWYVFDQIILSGAFIKNNSVKVNPPKTLIYRQDWLLEGGRPFRTYQGPRYMGGFSDHLPIFIDLYTHH